MGTTSAERPGELRARTQVSETRRRSSSARTPRDAALTRPRGRVLVIDDDPDFREIITELLEHEGYRVLTSTGVGAIGHLVSARPPCAIVLDLRMPRIDGWALLRVMRALGLSKEIPVIVVSAYLDERPLPKQGITATFAKPVDLDRVIEAVAAACDDAA